jgi:hypothetical protein
MLFFTGVNLLAVPSEVFGDSPLRTLRDEELSRILRNAANLQDTILLSNYAAQLAQLRNDYEATLNLNAFAARLESRSLTNWTKHQHPSSSLSGRLDGVFQFKGNWQADFGWYLGQFLTDRKNILRESQSEVPSLDVLSISYGKNRSTETTLGLLSDSPVLSGSHSQPLFSGLKIELHPLSQTLTPQEPAFQFSIEHGWNISRGQHDSSASQHRLQRTRPRVWSSLQGASWKMESALALEWYSDPDGIFGRVRAQRRALSLGTDATLSTMEKRWRLFIFSMKNQWHLSNDSSVSILFERVSNSIGQSSSPTWALQSQAQWGWLLYDNQITAKASAQIFNSRLGAVPQARLPLEINPGTEGFNWKTGLTWSPRSKSQHSFSLEVGQFFENRTEPLGLMHCDSEEESALERLNYRKNCKTNSFSIAWAMDVSPNL